MTLQEAALEADALAQSGSERELADLRATWGDDLEAAARSADFRERAVAFRAIGQFRWRQKEELLRRGLDDGSPDGVAKIFSCFKDLVPACGVQSLQDIINAAWQFELDHDCKKIVADHGLERDTSLVSELAYKTCEVFQIERTLKT